MNAIDYKTFCDQKNNAMIYAKDFLNEGEGTLLYGYAPLDQTDANIHVYLAGGEIHYLEFDVDQKIVKHRHGKQLAAADLKPLIHMHPERSRLSFAQKLQDLDITISFAKFDDTVITKDVAWFSMTLEELEPKSDYSKEVHKTRDLMIKTVKDMHFIQHAWDADVFYYSRVKDKFEKHFSLNSELQKDIDIVEKVFQVLEWPSTREIVDSLEKCEKVFNKVAKVESTMNDEETWYLAGFDDAISRLKSFSKARGKLSELVESCEIRDIWK